MENVYIQSTIGQIFNVDFSRADVSEPQRRAELLDMIEKLRAQLDAQATHEAPFATARDVVAQAEAEARKTKPDAPTIASRLKSAGETLGSVKTFTAAARGLAQEIADVGTFLSKLAGNG